MLFNIKSETLKQLRVFQINLFSFEINKIKKLNFILHHSNLFVLFQTN